ncbi:MAG TPA: hypothetical protein PLJ83_08760 [Spirochaetales bacterium]|nr:hypothetical protein [Spirochaetales bacterium]
MDNIILDVQTKSMQQTRADFDSLKNTISDTATELNALKKAQEIIGTTTEGLTKKQLELRESINSTGGIIQKMKGTTSENTQLYKELEKQLAKNVAMYERETTAMKKAEPAQKSIRAEIRATTQELAKRLAAGDISISQLYKEAKGAADLKDAYGDATKTISALSSDTFALDATIQGTQALASGFQIAQGAAALLGSEDENLQKGLLKLNGIMAVTQGGQQILNVLQKDSAFLLGVNIAAQKLYTFVIGETAGALRVLRVATMATIAGAVLIGLYELIKNWDKVAEAITGTTKAASDYKKASLQGIENSGKELAQLELLQASLKDENISRKQKNELISQAKKDYPEYIGKLTDEEFYTKALNTAIEKQTQLILARATAKAFEKELEDEIIKKRKLEESGISFLSAVFAFTKGGFAAIGTEAGNQLKESDEKIKSLVDGYKKAVEEVNKLGGTIDPMKLSKEKTKDTLSILAELEKQLKDVQQLIENQVAKDVLAGKDVAADSIIKTYQKQAGELQLKITQIKRALDELANGKINVDFLLDGTGLTAITPTQEQKDKAAADLANALSGIQQKAVDLSVTAGEATGVGNILLGIFGTDPNQKFASEMEARANVARNFYSTIEGLAAQTSSIISGFSQNAANAELSALEQKKSRGLISEKNYQKEVSKIKNEQAKKEHAARTIEAFAQIPLAILTAYISGLKFGPVVAGVMAGISGAFATLQAIQIASAPIPKFRKGVLRLPLGNNPDGIDTIPAMLNKHESVMTAEETNEHFDVLKAIREKKFNQMFMRTSDIIKNKDFGTAGLIRNIAYPVNVANTAAQRDQMNMEMSATLNAEFGKLSEKFDKVASEIWWNGKYIQQGNNDRSRGTGKLIKSLEKTRRNGF